MYSPKDESLDSLIQNIVNLSKQIKGSNRENRHNYEISSYAIPGYVPQTQYVHEKLSTPYYKPSNLSCAKPNYQENRENSEEKRKYEEVKDTPKYDHPSKFDR